MKNQWISYCMLFFLYFLYVVTLLKMQLLNICFPPLGRVDVDHVITRKMQLIAEAEVNTL